MRLRERFYRRVNVEQVVCEGLDFLEGNCWLGVKREDGGLSEAAG